MKLEFTENGITFFAGKGFVYAYDKNGNQVFSALDVFTKGKPTKKHVLGLYNIVSKVADEQFENKRTKRIKENEIF